MSQVRLSDTSTDQWDEMAELYRQLAYGVSHAPIGKMLDRANALSPFSQATSVLDNGCGPGEVMSRLLQDYRVPETCSLTCADFSEGMVNAVRKQRDEKVREDGSSPWSRLEAFTQDAMDLKDVESSSKSHVTAGWVYFMTADPQKCLAESKRVLKDGGVLTCSSWKDSQWITMMNIVEQVRPDKTMSVVPAGWREAGSLKAELEHAGFKDVESYEVETKMSFERMESLVEFIVTKLPHMQTLTKDMSVEDMEKLKKLALEKGREMCSSEPGELTGTALVAVGRK